MSNGSIFISRKKPAIGRKRTPHEAKVDKLIPEAAAIANQQLREDMKAGASIQALQQKGVLYFFEAMNTLASEKGLRVL
jgi:hypothetical protein